MWFTVYVIVTVLAHCKGHADIVQELITGGAQVNLQYEVKHNVN